METLENRIKSFLEKSRNGYQPTANYASTSGHPCSRKLVYDRLNWDEKLLPDVSRILIFREGNVHEDAVIKLLLESGIRIIETQRPFEISQIQLRGKIDGKIEVDDGKYLPCEIKSMNPFDFEKVDSLDDMKNSTKVWIRGWVAQMMAYLLGMNYEEGMFLLKNKVNGALKFILCKIDFEYAEKEWKKLELVNKCVKDKTYPDRISDRSVCQYCDFRHICLPDEQSDSINIVDNEELLELLDARDRLKNASKEYEAIDKKLKAYWTKLSEGSHLVGGKYQVKVTLYDRKFVNLPEEIKKKYEETKTIQKTTITKLK